MSETSPVDHLARDPTMAELIEEHGAVDLGPGVEPFERLVVSVINQQLSTASAAAIRERVFDAVEVAPEPILAADEQTLREAGLSEQKVDYLKNVAAAFDERGYSRSTFAELSDEAVIEELTEIHGIGVWTAKMFLIFSLRRADVFPVEDLGVRRGMEVLYGEMSRPEMVDRAERWRPYRSYASRYLWRAYDD